MRSDLESLENSLLEHSVLGRAREKAREAPPKPNLATPNEFQNLDPVFPGERWFFPWKTSPALWKSKLEKGSATLGRSGLWFVPIAWGQHLLADGTVDFGHEIPQNDFSKLIQVAQELKIELKFFLPIGPVPFLPNSGVPSFSARHLYQDSSGCHQLHLSSEGQLQRMFSFFDPQCFRLFAKFTKELAQYLTYYGIGAEIWGLEAGRPHGTQVFESYFQDHGPAFEQGFRRYLQTENLRPKSTEEEAFYGQQYREKVRRLYLECAQEYLGGQYRGVQPVLFLDNKSLDIVGQLFDVVSSTDFTASGHAKHESGKKDELCLALAGLQNHLLPTRFLGLQKNQDQAFFTWEQSFLNQFYQEDFLSPSAELWASRQSEAAQLKTLRERADGGTRMLAGPQLLKFFELYDSSAFDAVMEGQARSGSPWERLGLTSFLQQRYPYLFSRPTFEQFNSSNRLWDESGGSTRPILFLAGSGAENPGKGSVNVSQVLKRFMQGESLVVTETLWSTGERQRWELFVLENKIKSSRISLKNPNGSILVVEWFELGTGLLVLLRDSGLEGQAVSGENWEKILKLFSLVHLGIPDIEQRDSKVVGFWTLKQGAGMNHGHDLAFVEVRNLHLYNFSNYKVKSRVMVESPFAFLEMRSNGPSNQANIRKREKCLEVELFPAMSCVLEFGVFDPG